MESEEVFGEPVVIVVDKKKRYDFPALKWHVNNKIKKRHEVEEDPSNPPENPENPKKPKEEIIFEASFFNEGESQSMPTEKTIELTGKNKDVYKAYFLINEHMKDIRNERERIE